MKTVTRDPVRRARVTLLTNTPVPYRVPALSLLGQDPCIDLTVMYCTGAYIDANLSQADVPYRVEFLKGRYWNFDKRFIHLDTGIWRALRRAQPQVLITTGFVPTYLMAFAWARRHGVVHVPMTDGTRRSEQGLSVFHRLVRRWVFARSDAFLGTSEGSLDIYRSYGIADAHVFKSALCIDNARFLAQPRTRQVDFLFSGRFVAHKNPLFAMNVARRCAEMLGRKVSLRMLGRGALEPELRQAAQSMRALVDVSFDGYLAQSDLPAAYADARLFLFPSDWEPWGLVANEACASGLPVLIGPEGGAAGELVVEGDNGRVLPLDIETWAAAAAVLLRDPQAWASMSERSERRVQAFTFERSAQGMRDAIAHALGEGRPA